MRITEHQAQLLLDLADQIYSNYGLVIGYYDPTYFIVSMPKSPDFVICKLHPDAIFCFHRGDLIAVNENINNESSELSYPSIIPSSEDNEIKFDHKIQELFDRINNDILEGKIWFDPSFEDTVDGSKIIVTKKESLLHMTKEPVFEVNIFTKQYGTLYTYKVISELSKFDDRFLTAKKIIDNHWPSNTKSESNQSDNESLSDDNDDNNDDDDNVFNQMINYFKKLIKIIS